MTGQKDDMILVPREPTKAMIEAAYDCALAEDAKAVWDAMLSQYENQISKGNSGSDKR